jgi:GH25 family lysozyme M1 (1,4-beta-N-acetylmuramidase)
MRLVVIFLLLFPILSNANELPTLQKESRGLEVNILQKLLRRQGFDLFLNGMYDDATEKAVLKFQKKNGVYPSGIVNDSTWRFLLSQKNENQLFIKGIDISHYENEEFKNGEFPFEKISQFDLDFCFVKGTHGAVRKDDYFDYNFSKLNDAHLFRGAYHFFSLLSDDIDLQINNFLHLGIDFKAQGILPPVLDIEEDSRPFDKDNIILNRELVVTRIRIWLEAVEAATGRKPIIYCRKSFWEDVIGDPPGFQDYLLWVAYYRNDLPPKVPNGWNGKWHFWQYTDKGLLNGVGKFDLNHFSGEFQDLLKLANFDIKDL